MGGHMLSSVSMLRSLVAALLALAVLAGPAAALCANCCRPAPVVETSESSLSGASCCGCDEAMAPAPPPASDSLAAVKTSAPAAPAGVQLTALIFRAAAPEGRRAVAFASTSSRPAARSAPTPQRL